MVIKLREVKVPENVLGSNDTIWLPHLLMEVGLVETVEQAHSAVEDDMIKINGILVTDVNVSVQVAGQCMVYFIGEGMVKATK